MKTIEDYASEYATKWEMNHNIHNPDVYDLIRNAIIIGVNHIMSLPLAERLTAEEREKIKGMYKRIVVDVRHSDTYDCVPASDLDKVMESLELIFGKAMFEEGGGVDK